MTTKQYQRLEDGPMDDIDAAIFSGDTFHNRLNIAAFRDMMIRWEQGLQAAELIVAEMEQEND
jgi:hypothetical protein